MSCALGSRIFLSAFSIALMFSLAGCGGSTAAPTQQTATLASSVDQVSQTELQRQGIPGMTVAVAKNGTILYAQGYGVSDLTTQQATPKEAIFEIGSVSKQFTASLIMQLQ